jgi:hypothetical protein
MLNRGRGEMDYVMGSLAGILCQEMEIPLPPEESASGDDSSLIVEGSDQEKGGIRLLTALIGAKGGFGLSHIPEAPKSIVDFIGETSFSYVPPDITALLAQSSQSTPRYSTRDDS